MKTFDARVAVVTGGASGIGLAMARRFARANMKLVLADIEEAALEKAKAEIEALGATVSTVKTDVSKAEEVAALAERTQRDFGGVHILCNNAGVGAGGPIWEHTLEDWEWVFGVNLWGVVHGLRSFVPMMIAQGDEGHVVNTASIAGLTSNPFSGIYTATKHAVVAMTEVLHHELQMSGSKIKCSVLCPAWVSTNISDSARNRPGGTGEPRELDARGQAVQAMIRQAVETGLSPNEVAEAVFDAVASERFYILTHPQFNGVIEQRMTGLLEGKNPTYVPIG